MGKKKREHVVFDRMLKPKKSVPFAMLNRKAAAKPPRANSAQRREQP